MAGLLEPESNSERRNSGGSNRSSAEGTSSQIGEGWALYLYNSDDIEARRVACLLKRLVGLSIDQAQAAIMRAERWGRALITITSEEQAHEIIDQLAQDALHVECEPI